MGTPGPPRIVVAADPRWEMTQPTSPRDWAASSVAWAAAGDGRLLLATGSADDTARIWDPATGDCLTTLTGHTGTVFVVAFATTSEGRLLLATGSRDDTARIWDPATGDCLTTLTGHTGGVYGVAFATTSEGRLLLATGSVDDTARIWDPATGDCLTTLTGHTSGVYGVAFATTSEGRLLLATGSYDQSARIWDPATGDCLTTLTGHTSGVYGVAFATTSEGRLLLATGSLDDTARIWDPATGDCLTTLTGHTSMVYGVAFATTSDGRLLLATGSYDDTARIWDPATGDCLATITHPDDVNCVTFALDPGTGPGSGQALLLATACDDAKIRVYSVTPDSSPPHRQPSQPVGTVAAPFVSGPPSGILGPVGTVRVPADADLTLTGHAARVWSVAWATTGDGRLLLATGSADDTARIWDPATGDCLTTLTGHTGGVNGVAFATTSEGRLLLATGSYDDTARIWDPATGDCLTTLTGHTGTVHGVAWATTGDGRLLLATGSHDHTARIWDPSTGDCLTSLTGDTGEVHAVAWATTSDGRLLLAAGSGDQTARIWDAATGDCVTTLTGHTGDAYVVAWATTGDGRLLLATGSYDQTARIWDPATGDCLTTLTGHTSTIFGVTWATTGDGRLLLATASYDGTARIWDPATGECLATITHPNDVNAVAFATDPSTDREPNRALLLATTCDDTNTRIYPVILEPIRPGQAAQPLRTVAASLASGPPSEILGPVGTVRVPADADLTLTGHTARVWSVAWAITSDGRLLLATASADNTARIWDLATGDPLATLTGHTNTVRGVAWATAGDGRLLLVTGSQDHTARIWDPASGDCLAILTGHTDPVYGVAWATAGDGRLLLATGSGDGTARIWDPATGDCLAIITHPDEVNCAAFTPDPGISPGPAQALLMATGCDDNNVRVYTIIPSTGQVPADADLTLTGHTARVWSVAWATTSDGRLLLATGSRDGTARIWDTASGDCLATLTGHTDQVFSVAWTTAGDGRLLLATGSGDGTARIWDTASGECLAVITHPDEVNCAVFFRVMPAQATRVSKGLTAAQRPLVSLATACDDHAARIYRINLDETDQSIRKDEQPTIGGPSDATSAWVSTPAVLAAAVTGLFGLGERSLWPPLGLLADLLTLTGSDHDLQMLNDPALAALTNHRILSGFRALNWSIPARTALAALLIANQCQRSPYAPPPAAVTALRSALISTLRSDNTSQRQPPTISAADLANSADALSPEIFTLLKILGPDVAAADPTIPLRLAHNATYIPSLNHHILSLLTNPPAEVAASAHSSRKPSAQSNGTPTIAHHGLPTKLIPTHLGLSSDLFRYYQRNNQLLYRQHTEVLKLTSRPYTLVLDTTPPTYGPVEATLRLLTHLITVTLWSAGAVPSLVTTTRPQTPQPLMRPQHLLHIWTTRTLSSPDLLTPLQTAANLDQPVIVLTHHETASSHHIRPGPHVILITTHTPNTPAPPAPTSSYHHHIASNPTAIQIKMLIAAILTNREP